MILMHISLYSFLWEVNLHVLTKIMIISIQKKIQNLCNWKHFVFAADVHVAFLKIPEISAIFKKKLLLWDFVRYSILNNAFKNTNQYRNNLQSHRTIQNLKYSFLKFPYIRNKSRLRRYFTTRVMMFICELFILWKNILATSVRRV